VIAGFFWFYLSRDMLQKSKLNQYQAAAQIEM
jgi:hypothetical protein